MCGICGFTGQKNRQLIESMIRKIRHRGPDAWGIHETPAMTMGHVRLSIIDLSESANQPMLDAETDICLSFNGEIYNHKEIRADLEKKGCIFRTQSDTEVIIHAYKVFGEGFVKKLDGMFAIAIYDPRQDQLLLYRDRFGKKPLFYFKRGETIAFASELNALLCAPDCPDTISEEAFYTYLGLQYCFTSQCIIEGVHKVPPASCVKVDHHRALTVEKYWSLNDHPVQETDGQDDHEIIRNLFARAVKKRLISDVPVGVLLSGGVDSSAVTVEMSRMLDAPVRTFTAGFGAKDDEFPFADEIVSQEKTDHTRLLVRMEDLINELPVIVRFMDEPLADGGGVATYFVAKELAKHIKVVLVGEGGDELFGGYSWHHLGRKELGFVSNHIKQSIYLYLNSFAPHDIRQRIRRKAFHYFGEKNKVPGGADFSARMNHFERHALLPNSLLMKVDRMTMAFGVEARVPFLDEDLLRYVVTVPQRKRLGKKIFKEAMGDALPDSILNRPKQGFRMPFNQWLSNGLDTYAKEIILDASSFCLNAVGRKRISSFFKPTKHPIHKIRNTAMVWRFLIFELWLREVLKKENRCFN